MSSKHRYTTVIFLAIALMAFVVAHVSGQETKLEPPKNMGAEEYSVLPNENALLWMSLGQREFVADLIWIRALQYNDLRNEAHLAEHFADAIIALDPNFKAVYRWASVAALFSDGMTADSVKKANAYLALGAKQFPLDPYYDYSIAINDISYYPDDTPEKREFLRREAVKHLQIAMQKPGADPQITMLISGLLSNDDDQSAKIGFLQQAILTEADPETKQHLQTRLIMLSDSSGESSLMLIQRRDQWQRMHHPYLPIMLDYMISSETR